MTMLVVGATGSIGRLVVAEATFACPGAPPLPRRGSFPPKRRWSPVVVTRPDTLSGAVEGVDAVVFTLG